jgi:hypothetical protein
LAIEHQAEHATPALVERPTAILLDLAQAYALQRLYFPAVDLQALEHALIPLVKWLETQWDQQHRDFHRWRAEFRREEGIPLNDTYSTVYEETIEAVVRATPQSRKFARALARFCRHRDIEAVERNHSLRSGKIPSSSTILSIVAPVSPLASVWTTMTPL